MRDSTVYHLREATPQDVRLIERWLENPGDCRMAIGHTPLAGRDFLEWLEAKDQQCWILDGPEGPVGYGEMWVDADARDLELAHLVISPAHRNRGLGRVLTQLLFDRGKPYGFPSVFMRIYPGNEPALKCYATAGFTRVADLTPDMGPEWVWFAKSYDSGD